MKELLACLPVQDPSGLKGLPYAAIPLYPDTLQLPLFLICYPEAVAVLLNFVEMSCQVAHIL